MIGKGNVCHITMHQLQERFVASELNNKLLNTETEIGQNLIRNLETFKKVVTCDEITVEEKYKNRYIIKPFCKFIFGTNSLPRIDQDDEGFYRRLHIITFNKKFSDEEVEKFDKSKILEPSALDYFANISLREYLKIAKTGKFANQAESDDIINSYKQMNNSAIAFLNDDIEINNLFSSDNIVLKTTMYERYLKWCKEFECSSKSKKVFYDTVIQNDDYIERVYNGYRCFKNLKKSIKKRISEF